MEYDDDSWGPSILLQYYEIELDCSNFYDGLSFQIDCGKMRVNIASWSTVISTLAQFAETILRHVNMAAAKLSTQDKWIIQSS